MDLLDDVTGFEFEDVMVTVFERQGFQNVRKAPQVSDLGRDIIMGESTSRGDRRMVVVECKHTETVGRPVVQKLHSAVSTYEYDGPKRGMVVTTGRFTEPAREYARNVGESAAYHEIELLDGRRLREIAEEIGMDLYNGKIEILCEEALPVPDRGDAVAAFEDVFDRVDGTDSSVLDDVTTAAVLRPMVVAKVDTKAVFETGAGVIHAIDRSDRIGMVAERDETMFDHGEVTAFLDSHVDRATSFDEDVLEAEYDKVEVHRFGLTETDYRAELIGHIREQLTRVVEYTGDNNVTYRRECEPGEDDVRLRSFEPIYAPEITITATADPPRADTGAPRASESDGRGQPVERERATDGGGTGSVGDSSSVDTEPTDSGYEYVAAFLAAGSRTMSTGNNIEQCRACDRVDADRYVFCPNCGAIVCHDHVREERLEESPVCTICSVTDEFFWATKHFYSETNRDAFREEYEAMAFHRKALENRRLLAGVSIALFVLVLLTITVV